MRKSPGSPGGCKPQRIVHFSEALGGGVLRVVAAYANASAARGVETVVVFGRRPQTPPFDRVRELFEPSIELIEIAGFGRRDRRAAWAAVLAAVEVERQLHRADTGILHLHSSIAGVIGRVIPTRSGWRVLYSPHAYAFANPALGSVRRSTLRTIERILRNRGATIAVSEAEATTARTLGARDAVLVRNGVSAPAVKPGARVRRQVCCVGRADFQRAPDLLIEAVPSFTQVDVVWVGDGPWRGALEDAGVRVTGWLPHEDVLARIAKADIVVHLARYDGLSMALLEAMSMGSAIVVLGDTAAAEAVGDAALSVGNPIALARAVNELLEDDVRRQILRDAALRRHQAFFSEEKMLDALMSLYGIDAAPTAPVSADLARKLAAR